MSVCVAVVNPGTVHMECAESITAVVTTKAATWAFYHKAGPYLDMARNEVVHRFYEPQHMECDRLLMVDSDIQFTPDDITRLAEDDLPIVSGVYYNNFQGQVLPVVYAWGVLDGKRCMGPILRWPDCEFGEEYEEPIIVAGGVGAGFLMIKREVFDVMGAKYGSPLPWFAEEVMYDTHWGEDLCFCLRAKECGFDTHVDRRVVVKHYKTICLA